MEQIVDYQVIIGTDTIDLEGYVKAALKNGWQPFGGPYTTSNGWEAQAMIQYAAPLAWVLHVGSSTDQVPADFYHIGIDRNMSMSYEAGTPSITPSDAPGWPAPGVYGDPAGGE
jgi:hypothetical protein